MSHCVGEVEAEVLVSVNTSPIPVVNIVLPKLDGLDELCTVSQSISSAGIGLFTSSMLPYVLRVSTPGR
jgi:hypothetical protein